MQGANNISTTNSSVHCVMGIHRRKFEYGKSIVFGLLVTHPELLDPRSASSFFSINWAMVATTMTNIANCSSPWAHAIVVLHIAILDTLADSLSLLLCIRKISDAKRDKI